MMCSRREFAKLALAAPLSTALLAKINSKIDGVMVGAQTYSFRDRPVDQCVAAMKEIGLGYAELWDGHLAPKKAADQKAWRENPPMEPVQVARKMFADAGISLYAFTYAFRDNFSDAEIENGFRIAQALGTHKITSSSNVSMAKRIYPFAQKYNTYVAMHNHDSMAPNEFSTPANWEEAMADGRSKWIKINLDIGHFTGANFDPVSFLQEHHADIVTLHIKDRKRNHGPAVPFGEGDTKIKEVLQVLKTKKYPIPAMIEYEYNKPGMDTVVEVKKCFEFMKQALA
jgi:sugar phosphate isomerase/epimerase